MCELVITYSKTKTHTIKLKDGKTKEVANSYLWLVLENGKKILINAVKAEDKAILRALAKVQR